MSKLLLQEKEKTNYVQLFYNEVTKTYTHVPLTYVDLEDDDQIVGTFRFDNLRQVKISLSNYSRVTTASVIVGNMNRNFYPYKAYMRRDMEDHIMLGIDVFLDNPYKYIDKLEGFSFRTADVMAKCHGIPDTWEPRIRAGIPHFIEEIMRFKGHTVMPKKVLTKLLLEKLGAALPKDWDRHNRLTVVEGEKIGLKWVLNWERAIFKRFSTPGIDYGPYPHLAEKFVNDARLGKCQKKAFEKAIGSQFCLITGGAGTGKTTLIKSIFNWFTRKHLDVALCAFTGKAAQRMQNVVGHEAKTIHRTFQGGHGNWGKNRDNPLEADVVIIDEASMLSSELLYRIVEGTDPSTRIIMVGDTNQLQPIGMGCPFSDMLRKKLLPWQLLSEVFRTAEGSAIAVNAAEILNGNLVRDNNDDWVVAQVTDSKRIKEVINRAVVGLHEKGGDIIDDLLVLTPNKQSKQSLSTHWLNKMLHDTYMDLVGLDDYRGFGPIKRKVLQTQNNYETGLMNGTMGVQLAEENHSIFFNDTKTFFFETTGEIELDMFHQQFVTDAYAMTAHKAQGSEAPYVIVVVHSQSNRMLNRKWFYTAVTRAKKKVIVIGDARGLAMAVNHDIKDNRKTYLAIMIDDKFNEIPF